MKKILLVLLALFIIIQFIRPSKNKSKQIEANDISSKYAISENVQNILKTSCYDCHSNNTAYPWYAEIQPVGWWLNNHIKDGKDALNFSEFLSYPIRRQYHKLDDINKQIKKDDMPLQSYLIIHTNAKLSTEQKLLITNWINDTRNEIKAHYPTDSLVRANSNQQNFVK